MTSSSFSSVFLHVQEQSCSSLSHVFIFYPCSRAHKFKINSSFSCSKLNVRVWLQGLFSFNNCVKTSCVTCNFNNDVKLSIKSISSFPEEKEQQIYIKIVNKCLECTHTSLTLQEHVSHTFRSNFISWKICVPLNIYQSLGHFIYIN